MRRIPREKVAVEGEREEPEREGENPEPLSPNCHPPYNPRPLWKDRDLAYRGEGRAAGDGPGLALQLALVREDPVPDRPRRDRLPPVRRPEGRGAPEVWEAAESATQESSLAVAGTVREDKRAPGGFEMTATAVEILGPSEDYPITPKEHGVDFLMSQRHLWMRSSQQHAVLRVRSEVEQAIRDFFYERGYSRIDSPILTARRVRGDVDALRDRVLRREGVPVAVGPALPRARGGRVRQGLLLRADVPRREVEDAAAPDRVLDGGARGRVPGVRGPLSSSPRSSSWRSSAARSTAAART